MTSLSPRSKGVPFNISLLTLMLVVVGVLSASLLVLGWHTTSTLEEATIDLRMAALDESVTNWLTGNFRSTVFVQQALAATPAFARRDEAADGAEVRRQLADILGRRPAIAAAYAGYADGSFDYVGHIALLTDSLRRDMNAPPDATLFARVLPGGTGPRSETWSFMTGSGTQVSEEHRSSEFDPRKRPWYREALAARGPVMTEPYAFAVTGTPGVSVATPIGAGLGAIAFDFTLESLSQLVAEHKPTPNAIIIVATGAGNVLADSSHCPPRDPSCALADSAVRDLLHGDLAGVTRRADGRLDLRRRIGDEDWEILIDPMPPVFGERFFVAAAVLVADITTQSRGLFVESVAAALVIIVVAVLAILVVSLLLSGAIQRIARKTDRIRDLDFTDRAPVRSRIREIRQLSESVEQMRDGLEVFGRYVAKDLVRQIMRSPATAGVGGVQREVTVLFSDIEGFSRISEGIPPGLLTDRLSRYFDALAAPIAANRGTIDKFIGDSIMAFWNAPAIDERHVEHACRATLLAAAASRSLREKWHRRERPAFHTRFGLHTGSAVIGNVGARDRINYTLVGTVVNQASRLEALNKVYGTEILASGEVAGLTRAFFAWRHIDRVIPVGTDGPLDIFELMSEKVDGPADPFLERWDRARAAYAAGAFADAIGLFEAAASLRPADGPCGVMLQRCRQLADAPAGTPWDGVWRFHSK